MSAAAWTSWLDRLENARGQENMISAKVRAGNVAAIGTSVFALQQSVSRLKRDFEQLLRSTTSSVAKQELDRRERLLRQLELDLKSDLDAYNKRNSPAGSQAAREHPKNLLSMQNQIMKDQDQQLDLIGRGVSNLKNYSLTVKDETELHVRLLNDIDDDVSRATNGLESEGARAAKHRSNHSKQHRRVAYQLHVDGDVRALGAAALGGRSPERLVQTLVLEHDHLCFAEADLVVLFDQSPSSLFKIRVTRENAPEATKHQKQPPTPSISSTTSSSITMGTSCAAPPSDAFRRSDELRSLIAPRFLHPNIPHDRPVPTNAWWGNLLAWDGQKESDAVFSSPYTHKVVQGQPGAIGCGFSVSYLAQYRVDGPMNDNGAIRYYYYPPTIKNLLFSALELSVANGATAPPFTIDAWDDLGVVLTLALGLTSFMRTYLAVGNAFTTVQYEDLHVQLCSDHGWLTINGQPLRDGQEYSGQSFVVTFNNGQKWNLFFFPNDASASTVIRFQNNKLTTRDKFDGFVQAAYVSNKPDGDATDTSILQLYQRSAGVFAKGARVVHEDGNAESFSFDWKLVTVPSKEHDKPLFLHFALDHLRQMFVSSSYTSPVTPKPELTLHAHTRGPMQAYTTETSSPKWEFRVPSAISADVEKYTAFHPPQASLSPDRVAALNLCQVLKDEIYGNWDQALPHEGSYYFKGKALQKFGTMCLLAKKLAETTNPEMHNVAQHGIAHLQTILKAFVENKSAYPLVYDTVYKGIITSEAFVKRDINVDFGNAVYNDHHYHYGYVITAAAMVLHLGGDAWKHSEDAVKLRMFIDTLVRDVINPSDGSEFFPRFRNFDWFLGHSYSHGVTPMADGKDEESTSEEVNFFYGVALYSHITQNHAMEKLAKLMLKVYSLAVNTYFLIADGNQIHPEGFRKNKITGIFFDNKCDYTTWFSPNKECIHGIQMLPVSPITQAVRSAQFVKEEWDQVLSKLPFVHEWQKHASGWTSLLFANYAAVDSDLACQVLSQCPMDDGLSRAWALYIAATRKQ